MIILGIDPGIEKVGYSFFDKKGPNKFEFISSGLIKTLKTTAHEKRLQEIYDQLNTLCDLHKPDLLVMEKVFFFKNAKTVIPVAQGQGVLQLLAAQRDMKVEYFTPMEIKQIITGYGSSDKIAVHKMVNLLIKKDIKVKDDDESDAIACGLAYCCVNENLV